MSLLYISQQLTIYCGLFLLVIGVIGNGMNVWVFSSVRAYRTTPCTFYFLIASIDNMAYIIINLSSRIVASGYGIDLTSTSVIWCKIREFCVTTLVLISLSCSCLATIVHFFATSRSAYLRRFNNIQWAHRIVFSMIIVWCLHGIPIFLFYDISPVTKTCVNTNSAYMIYTPIYVLGLVCSIPVLIMVVFGYLTYRNIRLTRVLAEQQVDRQLARMTLIQVVFVVICLVPYGIDTAYSLITSGVSKDANRLLNESFAITIFILLSYFYYAVCLFSFCQMN